MKKILFTLSLLLVGIITLSISLNSQGRSLRDLVKKQEPPMEVTIETEKGTMTAILYTNEAPITTKNFIKLAESGFFNGLTFHRVEPGFVIQTGDPSGTGSGGSEETIPLEISPLVRHNSAGVLGMARTNDPNSASSQFYITLAPTPFLDNNYAVFGKLISGEEVAQEIRKGDKMLKVTVKALEQVP